MFSLNNFLIFTYIITSLFVVFSQTVNDEIIVFFSKIFNFFILFTLYQKNNKTGKLNFWYLTTLFFLLITDHLIVYKTLYEDIMLSFFVLNKVLYVTILSSVINKRNLNDIIKYTLLYFVLTGLSFYFINFNNERIAIITFILILLLYFLMCLSGGISFVNLIEKNKTKAFDFFIGILLITISETILDISFYIENSMVFVPPFFIISYLGRYYIYKAMIQKKYKYNKKL